ncbi:MAG: hypothetical protein SF162_05555 [bacterium]|nr:hypothetical protein [bacterium]
MVDLNALEAIVSELLSLYEIAAPPIPIESILQSPKDDMWDEIDVTQISGSFFKVGAGYSARMSMARVLARHISSSEWGQMRGLGSIRSDEAMLQAFARMMVMPASMILELKDNVRTPELLGAHFEVPPEEARLRLDDLTRYAPLP